MTVGLWLRDRDRCLLELAASPAAPSAAPAAAPNMPDDLRFLELERDLRETRRFSMLPSFLRTVTNSSLSGLITPY